MNLIEINLGVIWIYIQEWRVATFVSLHYYMRLPLTPLCTPCHEIPAALRIYFIDFPAAFTSHLCLPLAINLLKARTRSVWFSPLRMYVFKYLCRTLSYSYLELFRQIQVQYLWLLISMTILILIAIADCPCPPPAETGTWQSLGSICANSFCVKAPKG